MHTQLLSSPEQRRNPTATPPAEILVKNPRKPVTSTSMENLTYDRRHTNGSKALYPTFVNIGNKATINGDTELFVLKFKAKQRGSFKSQMQDAMLIDKRLNTHKN